MQKGIIACFIALSLCLSATARPEAPNESSASPAVAKTDTKAESNTPKSSSAIPVHNVSDDKPVKTVSSKNVYSEPETPVNPQNKNASATVGPFEEHAKPATKVNGAIKAPAPTNDTMSPTTAIEPIPPSTNLTTQASATKSPTIKPSTQAPTAKPPTPTTEHPKIGSSSSTPAVVRGFDGASFIGGILLALGLLSVGFMGFKYYKSQTERNYHTL